MKKIQQPWAGNHFVENGKNDAKSCKIQARNSYIL
jgi:hypothetical protein